MKLHIKYMESQHCKILVIKELKELDLTYIYVDIGMVELLDEITKKQKELLKKRLSTAGLELIDYKNNILIEKIASVAIELIHYYSEDLPPINYSNYISKKLGYDYTYLSNTFSQAKGITIQQFIIKHKIEKVKEWLLIGELNLTEISYKLNYSSVAHLSNQFKKVTGYSPSIYKQLQQKETFNPENM